MIFVAECELMSIKDISFLVKKQTDNGDD